MIKHTKLITGLGTLSLIFFSLLVFGDTPPDPPGGGPGGGDLPVGGGASILAGMDILMFLAGGYLAFKLKFLRKKN